MGTVFRKAKNDFPHESYTNTSALSHNLVILLELRNQRIERDPIIKSQPVRASLWPPGNNQIRSLASVLNATQLLNVNRKQ